MSKLALRDLEHVEEINLLVASVLGENHVRAGVAQTKMVVAGSNKRTVVVGVKAFG